MSMVVDFHSHILPRLDDGSRSVDESLSMLQLSRAQGVDEVILTPHFYPQQNNPERFLTQRRQAMDQLCRAIGPELAVPALRLGAEVYYYPQMSHSGVLEEFAIEGTRTILIEMPMGVWTDRMYRELEDIYNNLGLTPIVAHVDRYLGRFRDYGIPKALEQLPVLVQANASFFLSGSRGMKMLRKHQIHLLGSDCHNMSERKPNLGPALERIREKLGQEAVRWIQHNGSVALASRTGPDEIE